MATKKLAKLTANNKTIANAVSVFLFHLKCDLSLKLIISFDLFVCVCVFVAISAVERTGRQ